MTQRIDYPWIRVVLQADPHFYRDRAKEPEYEFTKRTFHANRAERWPYGAMWEFSSDFATDYDNEEVSEGDSN